MKKTTIIIVVIAILGACSNDDDGNRVVGEMMSDRIELTAEYAEPIVKIDVAEGESVIAGQVLVSQDDSRARARLAEAEAALQQSKARLDELLRGPRSELIVAARANVEGATQELEFRQSEQRRFQKIHSRGLASAESLERANAAHDAAQASLKLRLAQLEELLAGTTLEELSQAEQALKQLAARRDGALIDVDRHTLKSPVAGEVDSRLFELGERPLAGQPVLIVLSGQQSHARVFIPEALRVKIHSGTRALIYVDGLSDPVAGKVRTVASEAAFTPYYALTERDRGRLSYVAKIDVAEDRGRLPDGVPVEVEFELD
jgi:HlyD family secretion protein